MSNQAKALQDEEMNATVQGENEAQDTPAEAPDPTAIFRQGIIKLETPLLAADKPVEEIRYDFTKITNMEYIQAMDTDRSNSSLTQISQKQAFELFLKAAKGNRGLDETDLRKRLSMADTMAGIRVAAGFFVLTGNGAAGRIKSL